MRTISKVFVLIFFCLLGYSQCQDEITIVMFGRTGSGKSSLGNEIAGQSIFEVGHTLDSQTFDTISKSISLKDFGSMKVRIIDTPGFADNRAGMEVGNLLSNILQFISSLKNGFNIGIFCLPAKTRVDSHDIDELELLSILLGKDVFKHTFIAITQLNTLQKDERMNAYVKYPIELPKILYEHNIPDFGPDRILLADFNNFKEKFMPPLVKILKESTSYVPQIAQEINPDDPETINNYLASPQIKAMMKKYEEMVENQKRLLNQVQSELNQQKLENDELIRKSKEELEILEQRIKNTDRALADSQKMSEKMVQDYESYKEKSAQELVAMTKQLSDQEQKNSNYLNRIKDQDDRLASLRNTISDLQKTQEYRRSYHDHDDDDDDDIGSFFKGIFKSVVTFALNKLILI